MIGLKNMSVGKTLEKSDDKNNKRDHTENITTVHKEPHGYAPV